MVEEQESIEKTHKLHMANEARRLLSEPLLDGFFKYQEAQCFEAMKRLPLGTKLDEYQTVHHDLMAVLKLKNTLQAYIQESDLMIMADRKCQAEDI